MSVTQKRFSIFLFQCFLSYVLSVSASGQTHETDFITTQPNISWTTLGINGTTRLPSSTTMTLHKDDHSKTNADNSCPSLALYLALGTTLSFVFGFASGWIGLNYCRRTTLSKRGIYARVTYTKSKIADNPQSRTRNIERQPTGTSESAASYYNDEDLFRAISLDEPTKPVQLAIMTDAISCESIAAKRLEIPPQTDTSTTHTSQTCQPKLSRTAKKTHTYYMNFPPPCTGLF